METGRALESWKHERVSKAKGGKVFLAVSARGEVTVHEGWLTPKEARRAHAATEKGGARAERGA